MNVCSLAPLGHPGDNGAPPTHTQRDWTVISEEGKCDGSRLHQRRETFWWPSRSRADCPRASAELAWDLRAWSRRHALPASIWCSGPKKSSEALCRQITVSAPALLLIISWGPWESYSSVIGDNVLASGFSGWVRGAGPEQEASAGALSSPSRAFPDGTSRSTLCPLGSPQHSLCAPPRTLSGDGL